MGAQRRTTEQAKDIQTSRRDVHAHFRALAFPATAASCEVKLKDACRRVVVSRVIDTIHGQDSRR